MLRSHWEIAGYPFDHLFSGTTAFFQRAGKQTCQTVRLLRKITQNMDSASGLFIVGGNFHTRKDGDSVAFAQNLSSGDTGHGVMVGQGKNVQSCPFGIKNNIFQAGGAIGKFTVTVQVADHKTVTPLYKRYRKYKNHVFIIPKKQVMIKKGRDSGL